MNKMKALPLLSLGQWLEFGNFRLNNHRNKKKRSWSKILIIITLI